MANPRDNQQEPTRDNLQNDDARLPQDENETQNVSNEDANPQRGDQWDNYRTREMSSGSGENFYQNRERGNYTEGQQQDEGGGGSLY